MGARSEKRYRQFAARQVEAMFPTRAVEYEIMDRLNAYPKQHGAPIPFGEVVIYFGQVGASEMCIVECATKRDSGFAYWFKTLKDAVTYFEIEVYGYTAKGEWLARPKLT